MSDNGFLVLRELKERRRRDMAKNYCQRFTEDIFKKYDPEKKGLIKSRFLKNEFSGKHLPASIKHFSSKYIDIVNSIAAREHPTGFIDKMQLFTECKNVYEDLRSGKNMGF